jgi:hypothetical protein
MVKRSVRQRRTVTAADLQQVRSRSKQRKPKSLTRAAQQRFVARAKKRELMKRAAANAAGALPHAPTKLQQLDAKVRAGAVSDPLAHLPKELAFLAGDPLPDPPPFRGREEVVAAARDNAEAAEGGNSLTARVRALYEDGLVPVREIAQLCGVTERTLYKYAARGRWRKRYARRALHKGAGGRFIPQEEAGKATAGGLKALDPVALAAAEIACGEAGTIANRAAARTLAEHEARTARETVLREFETSARRLAALVKILKYTGPESRGLTPWRGKSAP